MRRISPSGENDMARLPRAVRVGLVMLLLLIRASRLPDAVLGRIPEMRGFHVVAYHDGAATIPGLVPYRFGAGIVFFNAPYFR